MPLPRRNTGHITVGIIVLQRPTVGQRAQCRVYLLDGLNNCASRRARCLNVLLRRCGNLLRSLCDAFAGCVFGVLDVPLVRAPCSLVGLLAVSNVSHCLLHLHQSGLVLMPGLLHGLLLSRDERYRRCMGMRGIALCMRCFTRVVSQTGVLGMHKGIDGLKESCFECICVRLHGSLGLVPPLRSAHGMLVCVC